MNFDELNALMEEEYTLSESELDFIEMYFDEMEITEEEKENRKSFAKDFFDNMIFVFYLFLLMKEYGYSNKELITNQLKKGYEETVKKYMESDRYMQDYIEDFSKETTDITEKHKGEKYYTSNERALIISVNEANSSLNYKEFLEASKRGYTKKTWITERDRKVRKTHSEVDRETIAIKEYFLVGDSLMLFPKDNSMNPSAEETCNCRCAIKYLK